MACAGGVVIGAGGGGLRCRCLELFRQSIRLSDHYAHTAGDCAAHAANRTAGIADQAVHPAYSRAAPAGQRRLRGPVPVV